MTGNVRKPMIYHDQWKKNNLKKKTFLLFKEMLLKKNKSKECTMYR